MEPVDISEFTRNATLVNNDQKYAVVGDGVLDKVLETITKHMDAQYKSGRIRGEDYAVTYSSLMQASLTQSVELFLKTNLTLAQIENMKAMTEIAWEDLAIRREQLKIELEKLELEKQKIEVQLKQLEAQIRLVEAQIALAYEQLEVEKIKALLYLRQIKGFDDNAKLQILTVIMQTYGLLFSVAKDNVEFAPPDAVNAGFIDSLVFDMIMRSSLGHENDGSIKLDREPFAGSL